MALARMAQDWAMRVMLIDGQGNFGSMDPDLPASMRYTEARLSKPAMALLADIDKDTVDFGANYDGSLKEPLVLPARFPNLLVNGAGGIAVGMATNIPPHNLGEVVAACKAYILNGAISIDELHEIVPGPDFPTGALILGKSGARSAYHTGKGSIIMRSRHVVEEGRNDRRSIVLTEIPYQVGKSGLVEGIADAAKDKRIEGISDIRDESSRLGVRIVIELKRDATPEVVLNQLWRHTQAQTSFPANMLAIRGGRPEVLTLRDIIESFVKFREEVITRRSKFELAKARDRAHILLGLVIAVTNLDEVVRIIRGSASPVEARGKLIAREWPRGEIEQYIKLVEAVESIGDSPTYQLTEVQVRAILDLRLHRLTALGRDEIGDELAKLASSIAELLHILGNRARLYEVMVEEFDAILVEFATPRKTEIAPAGDSIDDEDLIEREDMVVAVTLGGYIKRTPLEAFRAQRRGPLGHVHQGRGCRHRIVRDVYPHAGVVLFEPRQGLPQEGLAPARRRAAGTWSADGQPAAARRGREDHDRAAAARRRTELERPPRRLRHRAWQHPPQLDGRLRQCADQRQIRDALRGRCDRPPRRRRDPDRNRRCPDGDAQGQGHPLLGYRCPRIPKPYIDGRSWHPAEGR
jgi:DNA gyrase subunit A